MLIEISKIPPEGLHFVGSEDPSILELDAEENISLQGPVQYELFVEIANKTLVVTGKISLEIAIACSRCTDLFPITIQDAEFVRDYELTPNIETVDVTEDIREGILLNIPHFALCRPDCRGLCPQCKANLNHETCKCKTAAANEDWHTLDSLLEEDKSNIKQTYIIGD